MTGQSEARLAVVQIDKDQANAYVDRHHRHSKPVVQMRFAIAAVYGPEVVGVAIVEDPKARGNADGWTWEVTRVCTTGHPNACSFLYGACWRLIKGFGCLRAITYIREDEHGASVRAAGWLPVGHTRGRSWDTPSRRRDPDHHEITDRVRYEIKTKDWRAGLPLPPRIPVPKGDPAQAVMEFAGATT
jgi:hypothetical protein